LAVAAAFVLSRVVLDTIEERFTNQLIEAGKLTNDWMVGEEDRLLETLRLIAHTQGLPNAVLAADAEQLRRFILPLAVNSQEEAIEILDRQGTSVTCTIEGRKPGDYQRLAG
jgi:adenylate cyclase